MKFIDECNLKIEAGNGGKGIVSFRTEAMVPRGGPDGGRGGDGGNVYFVGDKGVNTLLSIKLLSKIKGNNGVNGGNKNKTGANGEDVYIHVPIGTVVKSDERIIQDVVDENPYLIAKGGRGGKGNVLFKSPKNIAPRLSENGDPGEKFAVNISLKVLADVGLVGKPSAGKSTLLSKISNSKPKIADYDFTTLTPQLGLVKVDNQHSFVAVDLPGLIEGAADGKGLGIRFLKHIERCRVIAHIVDFGSSDKNPIEDFLLINDELKTYSLNLEKRPKVIIANKSDLEGFQQNLEAFKEKFPHLSIVETSSLTETNIDKVKYKMYEVLNQAPEIEIDLPEEEVIVQLENPLTVKKNHQGVFEVTGQSVEKIVNRIPFDNWENKKRFFKRTKELGVWDALRKANIKNGDTVRLYTHEFEWVDDE